MEQPNKHEERKSELELLSTAAIEQLAGQLANGQSENYLKLLTFWSRFHRYSHGNTLLLMLQKPDASQIASYSKWKELGWQVRKGATAAWIFAPILSRQKDEITGEVREVLSGYRLVPVFADTDLANLDEKPLPTLWHPLPDDCRQTVDLFIKRLRQEGITVEFRELRPGIQGMATKGRIILSTRIPDSRNLLACAVHEAAHCFLHLSDGAEAKPTKQAETEAESCAYVVLASVGIQYQFSADYLTHYRVTPDELKASLSTIQAVVRRISLILERTMEERPQQVA